MARPLGVEYAGACYHVINRVNYRQRIFAGKGAAESFERALVLWEEKLRWTALAAGVDLEALPRKKMSSEKCMLSAVMKKCSSVSNRWLAERLEMGSVSTPAQGARRAMADPKAMDEINRILGLLERDAEKR